MKSKQIVETATRSKQESDLIKNLAENIKSEMDLIIQYANETEPPTEPPVEPEPIPNPPDDNTLTGTIDIRSLGILPIDEQVVGYTYKDSLNDAVTVSNSNEKVYYVLWAKETGNVTFSNILTDGNPTTFNLTELGAYILKNNNGSFSVEKAKGVIHQDLLEQYDFSQCTLYIPTGTYIHFQGHGINTLFFFDRNRPKLIKGGKDTKLLGVTSDPWRMANIDCKLKDIKLFNILPSTGTRDKDRDSYYDNVELNYGSITNGGSYILMNESKKANFYAEDLKIICKDIYTGIWIEDANNVVILNSKIETESSSHPIRVNAFENLCLILNNDIDGHNVTGIQFATQRRQLMRGAFVIGNKVNGSTEESISLDSFGNNTTLVPVITKSVVESVEDWSEEGFTLGRVVTLKDHKFVELNDPNNVSLGYRHRNVDVSFVGDATKFLFVIESGKLEYQYCEISKSEVVNGKLKVYLNKYYSPEDLLNAEIGLHTGCLNFIIEGNTVTNARPETTQPGHGISLWGSTYGCKVLNNTVDNCKQGIHVAGFGSFGVTNPDFFNHSIGNIVDGNLITNCDESYAFDSLYGERKGFRNKFTNNKIKGGTHRVNNQLLFEKENNIIE